MDSTFATSAGFSKHLALIVRYVLVILAVLVVCVGCTSVVCNQEPSEKPNEVAAAGPDEGSSTEEPLAVRFWRLYQELKEFQRPRLTMSNTALLLDCDAYREIVRVGEPFLPFIVETIKDGDFFMNRAMADITGIEMFDYFPEEDVLGETEISDQWLRWWEENRDRYLPEDQEP